MSIAFIACVEPGYLEQQAVLLFSSIRRWAGRYAGSRIMAFQPRRGVALSGATTEAFARLDVEHHRQLLNADFEHDPLANKIFACAWAEAHVEESTLVFVDSDSFFTGEPASLDLQGRADASARPARFGAVGSSGLGDPREDYWRRLHELCGTRPAPPVETTVDRRRVHGYWNSGLVACRREAGLLQSWEENYRRVASAGLVAAGHEALTEQLTLAGTLAGAPAGVEDPGPRYNYPLVNRRRLPEPEREAGLEELVHVHYFETMAHTHPLARLTPAIPRSAQLDWLAGFEPLQELANPLARAIITARELERAQQRVRAHRTRARRAKDELREHRRRERRLVRERQRIERGAWWRLGRLLRLVPHRAR